jgi:hypothetical protein
VAKGTRILVQTDPHGTFDEGVINDTSKPGTFVEQVPATAGQGGRLQFRARSRSAGAAGPVAILLEDNNQGFAGIGTGTAVVSGGVTVPASPAPGPAYVSGTRCRVYWPAEGEDLNAILGDVAGTGDIVTQGDLFGINNNGKLIANSSYASAPFQAQETLTGATGDELIWVKFLGNN